VVEMFESNLEAFKPLAVRLKKALPGSEAALISTCLRFEAMIYLPENCGEYSHIRNSLGKFFAGIISASEARPPAGDFYNASDIEALRHLYSVMAGFESEDVGEIQVLGQIKDGFKRCSDEKLAGPVLHKILGGGISCVQKIRDGIPVFADRGAIAGRIMKRIAAAFSRRDASATRVLLAGRSSILSTLRKKMIESGFEPVLVDVIRNVDEIRPSSLKKYGIVVSNLQDALFGAGIDEFAGSGVEHVLFDLSVCRNFSPDTGKLDNVEYYSIDDLTTSNWSDSERNGKRRERKDFMKAAGRIVEKSARESMREAELAGSVAIDIVRAQSAVIAAEFDTTFKKMKGLSEKERDSLKKLRGAITKKAAAELMKIFKEMKKKRA